MLGNGGTEVDMIHEIPAVELEPFAVEDRHFNRTSQLQQRQMQDKPVSVWDRIKLNDRSAQNNTNMFGAEGQFASVHFENRGKWKKNGAAGLRAGSGKGRGGREQRYRGAPYSGRTVDVYGHILEDALPSVNAEHMQNQDSLHRRNSFNSHKPGGQRSENGFSSSVGKVVGDEQVTIANEVSGRYHLNRNQVKKTSMIGLCLSPMCILLQHKQLYEFILVGVDTLIG